MKLQYEINGEKTVIDVPSPREGINTLLDELFDVPLLPDGSSVTAELTYARDGSKMASVTLYAPDLAKMLSRATTRGSA